MIKPPVFFKMNRHIAAVAFVAVGATLVTTSTVFSAEPYPKAIRRAVESGVNVVKSFPAVSGLTGWVMLQDGRYSTVYTTADKKTLFAGALIGENGENFGALYEEKYVPKPDLGALFQRLEKSSYVAEGAISGPKSIVYVYVFVDANCPFCHYTWLALQPYEKIGLQVRWIPVATLGPTSMPKAIEIMAAADQVAAFRKMEENHGKPGVIWKDKQGKVQVKGGMPRLSELPAITGLLEQKNGNSSLNKFR